MNQNAYSLRRAVEILRLREVRMREIVARHAAEREADIKDALGRWVSELEPVIVYDCYGRFLGLTHAGQPLGARADVHVASRRPPPRIESA